MEQKVEPSFKQEEAISLNTSACNQPGEHTHEVSYCLLHETFSLVYLFNILTTNICFDFQRVLQEFAHMWV